MLITLRARQLPTGRYLIKVMREADPDLVPGLSGLRDSLLRADCWEGLRGHVQHLCSCTTTPAQNKYCKNNVRARASQRTTATTLLKRKCQARDDAMFLPQKQKS